MEARIVDLMYSASQPPVYLPKEHQRGQEFFLLSHAQGPPFLHK